MIALQNLPVGLEPQAGFGVSCRVSMQFLAHGIQLLALPDWS